MTFIHISANVAVFIDANTFIYYFTPDPVFGPECQTFTTPTSTACRASRGTRRPDCILRWFLLSR